MILWHSTQPAQRQPSNPKHSLPLGTKHPRADAQGPQPPSVYFRALSEAAPPNPGEIAGQQVANRPPQTGEASYR